MRLLSPTQIKQTQNKQLEQQVEKQRKLASAIQTMEKELNDLKTSKEALKTKIEADFEHFVFNISRKQIALQNEITVLERKKQALTQDLIT